MIFHENCLLADNSQEITNLIFFEKSRKMLQNLLSAAVVIGALRVNNKITLRPNKILCVSDYPRVSNFLKPH